MRAWARLVAQDWDTLRREVEVIYAHDRGPRPKLPYLSLQIIAERSTGRPARHTSDTAGPGGDYEAYSQTHYLATASINVYGSEHREIARALVGSLERDDVTELVTGQGVYLVDVAGLNDVPAQLDTEYEPRTQVDVRFAFSVRHEFEAEGIETIAGTVELKAGDGETITSPFEAP